MAHLTRRKINHKETLTKRQQQIFDAVVFLCNEAAFSPEKHIAFITRKTEFEAVELGPNTGQIARRLDTSTSSIRSSLELMESKGFLLSARCGKKSINWWACGCMSLPLFDNK